MMFVVSPSRPDRSLDNEECDTPSFCNSVASVSPGDYSEEFLSTDDVVLLGPAGSADKNLNHAMPSPCKSLKAIAVRLNSETSESPRKSFYTIVEGEEEEMVSSKVSSKVSNEISSIRSTSTSDRSSSDSSFATMFRTALNLFFGLALLSSLVLLPQNPLNTFSSKNGELFMSNIKQITGVVAETLSQERLITLLEVQGKTVSPVTPAVSPTTTLKPSKPLSSKQNIFAAKISPQIVSGVDSNALSPKVPKVPKVQMSVIGPKAKAGSSVKSTGSDQQSNGAKPVMMHKIHSGPVTRVCNNVFYIIVPALYRICIVYEI